MTSMVRHIRHYRSPVDDREQPYIIEAPDESASPIPCIVWLHDVLQSPVRDSFVETALRTAAHWKPALESGPSPAMLVIPYGRGNAGWLGVGGRDLLDVLDEVKREFPIDADRIALVGEGAGGTGALQWGCWYPDRWCAVAAAGAAVDERLDLPPGSRDHAPWQRPSREQMRPAALVRNLAGIPLWFEHPSSFDGMEGTADSEHFHLLTRLCQRHRLANAAPPPIDDAEPSELFREPARMLEWMLSSRREPAPYRHMVGSPRSYRRDFRVERLADSKPALIEWKPSQESVRIRTSGAQSLSLDTNAFSSIVLDKQHFTEKSLANAKRKSDRAYFEKTLDEWQLITSHPSNGQTQRLKSHALPGPIADMRWDGIVFVVGTLGDDDQVRTLDRSARQIRDRWVSGEDSLAMHSGSRESDVDYPVVLDHELSDEVMAKRHLVLLGTPRTNLLLSRWASQIGCQWLDRTTEGLEPFRIAGRTYRERGVGFFLLGLNPDFPDRYVLTIGGTSREAYARAASLESSHFPDYLIFDRREVLAWGNAGPDWRP